MAIISRRTCLSGLGVAAAALGAARAGRVRAAGVPAPEGALQAASQAPARLDITEFQPRSMLHVPATRVERARFPVIDVHTHLGFSGREGMSFAARPETLLPVMDRKNVRMMVNATGGSGRGLDESLERFDRRVPGRFVTFAEPRWEGFNQPGWGQRQAEELGRAREAGARGLKVLKTLGLGLRENGTTGALIKVDDPRLDPMWDACGALRMPVLIHVADPEAFFLPIDRFNERFEELNNHPDWSFHGADFPSFRELVDAFDRIVARHPKTQFIAAHFGLNAENLPSVSERMDRYANLHVDTAARIGELGRQPRFARRVFERHQDRILFGTDAVPDGHDTPQQVFGDDLYEIYFRCLETEDEYFDYAPAPVPPQGRWAIYGLGLPEGILRKVYHDNAARLLGL
ncbi:MAG: amidohydrolase family protein [Acidobacteria bacterium]|nr:amidohydrolase family protein [Acidobacteriota bacterium]